MNSRLTSHVEPTGAFRISVKTFEKEKCCRKLYQSYRLLKGVRKSMTVNRREHQMHGWILIIVIKMSRTAHWICKLIRFTHEKLFNIQFTFLYDRCERKNPKLFRTAIFMFYCFTLHATRFPVHTRLEIYIVSTEIRRVRQELNYFSISYIYILNVSSNFYLHTLSNRVCCWDQTYTIVCTLNTKCIDYN